MELDVKGAVAHQMRRGPLARTCLVFCLLVVALCADGAGAVTASKPSNPLRHQLVYVRFNLAQDSHVDEFRAIAERAAQHGYTGIVFAGSFDRIDLRDAGYFDRLGAVKEICENENLELIPLMFSAGYAGGILAHNPNLAAGIPVTNVPFAVNGHSVRLISDPKTRFAMTDSERQKNNRMPDISFHDKPGTVTFVDESEHHGGSVSLRFENFDKSKDGKGRLMQKLDVTPFRCYRVSLWVKTRNLERSNRFQVQVLTADERVLMMWSPGLAASQGWTEVSTTFNSLDNEKVNLWVGIWRGRAGTFWVDDLSVEEVAFNNVVRRRGTPLIVRSGSSDEVYVEGEDYEFQPGDFLTYTRVGRQPNLRILPGGRINDGDQLLVDYFQALSLKRPGGQTSVCMSEPETYEIWGKIAKAVHEQLAPEFYFLSMDEVRQGGWCELCKSRGLSAAELIGACITRQTEIVRKMNPKAEIIVWSDMLDPNHNAKSNYYLFKGDFKGSWEQIPKDLIVACWHDKVRGKSLGHFDRLGFRTMGCGYYDSRSLDNAKGWMKSLAQTRGACGIMYTTWTHDYDFLEQFGDVVAGLEPEK
ncbi:MAG: hypothetical protein JSW50_05595 [Candidatus Latescibacterota bacterium]|nr:MAG: hypothetical protein JSW50_05595 [Candidatus Latescibacterota bacterium]